MKIDLNGKVVADAANRLRNVFAIGETVAVEFKRCRNRVGSDTYETICAFLNRYGGDIYLGVDDDGTIVGVPEKSAPDIIKNIINTVNNPEVIYPTTYVAPDILKYKGKCIIRIHVPQSSEVHTCKKIVYDRAGDADVKVKATSVIAEMYIRKQNVFTEKKIFPYAKDADLRFDILPRIKKMAINYHSGRHPWSSMSDKELIQSAGLYSVDKVTGAKGYNLAAIMLLGKDDVIRSVSTTYRTDALLRKVNTTRYDDRLIVETNLIDSYELLMGFAEKHLLDKFYLEDDVRVSLRNAIAREMLVNTLIHREFSSSYIAKFIIEKERMFTENASRATMSGVITPENYEPAPKNPIIASFFRNIGLADTLGSGVRNLHYYGKRYSGKMPQLIEGDIFKIIVPLDDEYSFEAGMGDGYEGVSENVTDDIENVTDDVENVTDDIENVTDDVENVTDDVEDVTDRTSLILGLISENDQITASEIAQSLSVTKRTVLRDIEKLKKENLLERVGSERGGRWIVI